MLPEDNSPLLRQVALIALLGGLVLLSHAVLRPFLVPVIWALILAYVTWPLYQRVLRLMHDRRTLAALVMTLGLALAFVLPILWLVSLLRVEVAAGYAEFVAFLATKPQLPPAIARVPWLGEAGQELLDRLSRDPAALGTEIGALLDQFIGQIR